MKEVKREIMKEEMDYNGYHPAQKPVLLLEDLIKTFSNENDLGVDLTMLACKNLNRNYIMMEQDPKYYEIACKRVQG